jgi:hypothetical protein
MCIVKDRNKKYFRIIFVNWMDLHLAAGFIIFICVLSGELSDGLL